MFNISFTHADISQLELELEKAIVTLKEKEYTGAWIGFSAYRGIVYQIWKTDTPCPIFRIARRLKTKTVVVSESITLYKSSPDLQQEVEDILKRKGHLAF
jgi:hypothetical protein